ncbi:extracellular substrate-binding protein [Bordetella pertussis]|nr:extracellular substrate-binding protein [Bordetella pertussis]
MNEEGSQVYLDKPAVVEAAQFWQDLSVKHGVMPKGTIDWGTTPERAADWSIATGYVAVTPAAWQTERMKKYAQEVPAATMARDQLEVSVAEFSTHENQRVTKVLNDALQAALTGSKTPQQALTDAQREADRVLRSYK